MLIQCLILRLQKVCSCTNVIVKIFENGQHDMPTFPILDKIANPSSSTMVVETSIPSHGMKCYLLLEFVIMSQFF